MDNIYHRYLNLPFEIARPPITHETPQNWEQISLRGKYQDPNIESWLKKLGLECLKTEVFYTPPNGSVPIHTDDYNDKDDSPDDHVKINMTWGSEKATVRWWTSDKTYRWQDPKADYSTQPILLAKEEDSTLVFERNTNKPSLLNVGVLHSTHNPTNEPRWTICFVPGYRGKMIKLKTALRIFKKFIINE
jgi:hypothetical protein